MNRRVIEYEALAAGAFGKMPRETRDACFAERIVQIDDEIARRNVKRRCVRVHDAYVFACQAGMLSPPSHDVVAGGFAQRRRDFDADDLVKCALTGKQYDSSEACADVDKREPVRSLRQCVKHGLELRDRRRFVMRRVFDRIADCVRIQFTQKEQRFRDDAVFCIESLAAASSTSTNRIAQ